MRHGVRLVGATEMDIVPKLGVAKIIQVTDDHFSIETPVTWGSPRRKYYENGQRKFRGRNFRVTDF